MKILIVNPFGIGDVLFCTPLIANIKAADPEGFLGFMCNARTQDVLSGNAQIDKIFVFEKDQYRHLWAQDKLRCIKRFIGFLFEVRKYRFDAVIDLSLGHQYSLFFLLFGIKKRIGYNYRKRGRFLTDKIDIAGYDSKPITEYYLGLLKFLDILPRYFEITMAVSEADQEKATQFFNKNQLKDEDLVIGIIPAGGASWGRNFSYRHWPPENYSRLADRLIEELSAKIIIFGSSNEIPICRIVEEKMRHRPFSACGQTTLKQFAALLAKCDLIVCNDGGPLHVAVSQGAFTVSIFGPVDEKVYGPYPPGPRHIVVTKDIDCRPCYKRFKLPKCSRQRQCVRDIRAENVFNIIKANLQEKNSKQ